MMAVALWRRGRGTAARLRWIGLAFCLLAVGCYTPEPAADPGFVSRTVLAPRRENLVVNGGGRLMRSLVLLPENYEPGRQYGLLLALHNFSGNAEGFGRLIHAERLLARGVVVILPEAAGLVPEWQGSGVTITFAARHVHGRRVDDIGGLAATLAAAQRLYQVDPADVNVAGFSQGATLALEFVRHAVREKSPPVRRVFLVAGSIGQPFAKDLALPHTALIAYEPGRNGPQDVANFFAGEPDERDYFAAIVAANGCTLANRDDSDGVDRRRYACRDDTRILHYYEPRGEHAWPGQDAENDSWLMGRGSDSRVDFTRIIADEIGRSPAASAPR